MFCPTARRATGAGRANCPGTHALWAVCTHPSLYYHSPRENFHSRRPPHPSVRAALPRITVLYIQTCTYVQHLYIRVRLANYTTWVPFVLSVFSLDRNLPLPPSSSRLKKTPPSAAPCRPSTLLAPLLTVHPRRCPKDWLLSTAGPT